MQLNHPVDEKCKGFGVFLSNRIPDTKESPGPHRPSAFQVGRAGRFGTKGLAITFISNERDTEVIRRGFLKAFFFFWRAASPPIVGSLINNFYDSLPPNEVIFPISVCLIGNFWTTWGWKVPRPYKTQRLLSPPWPQLLFIYFGMIQIKVFFFRRGLLINGGCL